MLLLLLLASVAVAVAVVLAVGVVHLGITFMHPSIHSFIVSPSFLSPQSVREHDSSGGGGGGKAKGSKAKSTGAAALPAVWDVEDLLGWNPLAGPPPDGLPDPLDPTSRRRLTRLEVMARSLEWASLVELSGLVRGSSSGGEDGEGDGEGEVQGAKALSAECRLLHVLKWLPAFRELLLFYIYLIYVTTSQLSISLTNPSLQPPGPYLGPLQCRSPDEHRQQTALAVSVVMALSRDGELRIPALLLPHEYFFLREHLPVHLARRDVALVGRSMDVRGPSRVGRGVCLSVSGCVCVYVSVCVFSPFLLFHTNRPSYTAVRRHGTTTRVPPPAPPPSHQRQQHQPQKQTHTHTKGPPRPGRARREPGLPRRHDLPPRRPAPGPRRVAGGPHHDGFAAAAAEWSRRRRRGQERRGRGEWLLPPHARGRAGGCACVSLCVHVPFFLCVSAPPVPQRSHHSLTQSLTHEKRSLLSFIHKTIPPPLVTPQALLVREFRGFGPLPLEAVDRLLRWQRQDADPSPAPAPSTPPLLLLPNGTPDARLEGMAARVQAVKTAAKKRAAAGPAPAPVAAAAAPVVATAATANGEMSEMEKRVLARGKAVEAAKEAGGWGEVLSGLQALAQEPMTVAALTTTKIGRVVNKLRKAEDEGVAALSKQLVEQWKGLVAKEEQQQAGAS